MTKKLKPPELPDELLDDGMYGRLKPLDPEYVDEYVEKLANLDFVLEEHREHCEAGLERLSTKFGELFRKVGSDPSKCSFIEKLSTKDLREYRHLKRCERDYRGWRYWLGSLEAHRKSRSWHRAIPAAINVGILAHKASKARPVEPELLRERQLQAGRMSNAPKGGSARKAGIAESDKKARPRVMEEVQKLLDSGRSITAARRIFKQRNGKLSGYKIKQYTLNMKAKKPGREP